MFIAPAQLAGLGDALPPACQPFADRVSALTAALGQAASAGQDPAPIAAQLAQAQADLKACIASTQGSSKWPLWKKAGVAALLAAGAFGLYNHYYPNR